MKSDLAQEVPIISKSSLNGYMEIHCSCGQSIAFDKQNENHFADCPEFKAQFGELLSALINTAKKVKDRNDYNIIKYLFHIQKYQIRRILKQAKSENKPPPIPMNPFESSINVGNENYEEIKIRQSQPLPQISCIVSNNKFEEVELVSCNECNRQFPGMNNIVCLPCDHNYCFDCIKHKAFKDFPETGQVVCKCRVPLKELELTVFVHKI